MPIKILPKDSNGGDKTVSSGTFEKQRRAWNSPQNRRDRQKEYIKKHGAPGPRRRRLGTTDKDKELREAIRPFDAISRRPKTGTGIKKERNIWGPSDEKVHKKPHSTDEGRMASIKRAAKRFKDKTYKIEDYGMKKGGRAKGPNFSRPTGPHMWVRDDKRKKYNIGGRSVKRIGSTQQGADEGATGTTRTKTQIEKYHKRSERPKHKQPLRIKKFASGGAVLKGKKVGCQIK